MFFANFSKPLCAGFSWRCFSEELADGVNQTGAAGKHRHRGSLIKTLGSGGWNSLPDGRCCAKENAPVSCRVREAAHRSRDRETAYFRAIQPVTSGWASLKPM